MLSDVFHHRAMASRAFSETSKNNINILKNDTNYVVLVNFIAYIFCIQAC